MANAKSKEVTDIEAEYGQRRQKIYEAARALSDGEPLSDELRAIAAETLRQWLAIEFYKKRNLLSEYENARLQSNQTTLKTVNDMQFLNQAAKGGPEVFKKAVAVLAARESDRHVAATLVEYFAYSYGLNNTKASERAAEFLGRDPESIRQQYLRYKRTKK